MPWDRRGDTAWPVCAQRKGKGEAPGLPSSSCPPGWLLGTWCPPPLVSQEQSCPGSAGPRPTREGVPGWADAGAHRPQDHSRAHSHTRAPTTPGERTHSPGVTHEETEAQSRMTHSFNSRSWAASQQNSNPRIFLRQPLAPERQGRVWFTLSSLLGPQHPAYV